MKKIRDAVNGRGRIGRNVVRAIYESGRGDIDIAAINDLGPVETNARLPQFDFVHGRFPHEVVVKGDTVSIGADGFKAAAIGDHAQLPNGGMGIERGLMTTIQFTHLSTTGGAFPEWLEGGKSPGTQAFKSLKLKSRDA